MVAPADPLARLRAAGVRVSLRPDDRLATLGAVPAELVPVLRDPDAKAAVAAALQAELHGALARAGDDPAAIVDALAAAGLPLRLSEDGAPAAAPGTPASALKLLREHRAAVLVELRRRGMRHWLGEAVGSPWRRLAEAVGGERAGQLDDVLADLLDNPAVADRHAIAEGLWSRVGAGCAGERGGAAAEVIARAYAAAVACDLPELRAVAEAAS